jgi:hypothetical protein
VPLAFVVIGLEESPKLARLIREAERGLDGFLPKIIRGNTLGFQSLHKRTYRSGRGICKSVGAKRPVAHRIDKRPQRLDRFGGWKALCLVKDMKDIVDLLRQLNFRVAS